MPWATLHRVVVRGVTLRQLAARHGGVALPAYRYRFRQTLQRFVARPRVPGVPRGPLVLLVDGLWFQFDGRPWVLYLSALRACQGRTAVFLDPLLLPGKEGVQHWEQVLVICR